MSDAALDPPTPGAAAVRALRAAGFGLWGLVAVVLCVIGGVGWLWTLRQAGWLGLGKPVYDALPLLQLADADGQALLRVIVAFLSAGIVLGACLWRAPRLPRALLAGVVGLLLLLFLSQESYAIARNVPFGQVVFSRMPPAGPWIEGILLAVGCLIPGRLRRPVAD